MYQIENKTTLNRKKHRHGEGSVYAGGEGNREPFVESLPCIPSPEVDIEVPPPPPPPHVLVVRFIVDLF